MSRILISSLPSRCLSALMCLLRGTVTDSAVLWAPTRAQSLILLAILGVPSLQWTLALVLLPGCELVKLSDSSFSKLESALECRVHAPWRGRTIRESVLLFNHTWWRTWQKTSLTTTGFPPFSDSAFFPLLPTPLFFLTEILCSLVLNWGLTVGQNGGIHWLSRVEVTSVSVGSCRLCTVPRSLQCKSLAEETSFPCYSYSFVTFPYSCVVEVWIGKQWRQPCVLCSVFLSLFGWHQRSFHY